MKIKQKLPGQNQHKNNLRFFRQAILFIFVLLLPTQLGRHFWGPFSYINGVRVDYLSLILYLTDILFFLLFIFYFKYVFAEFKKNYRVYFVLFILAILNIIFSPSIIVGSYRLLKYIQFISLFFIFKNTITNKLIEVVPLYFERSESKRTQSRSIILSVLDSLTFARTITYGMSRFKLIISSFVIAGIFELILSLLQLYYKSSVQGIAYFFGERYLTLSQGAVAKASFSGTEFLRPYGTFSHPNSLGGFYLLLYTFFLTDKRINQYPLLKFIGLAVFSGLVFISFSKTAIFVYVLLTILFYIFKSDLSCLFCRVVRVFGLLILLGVFLSVSSDPESFQKRAELFINSLTIFLQNPFFGVGLGQYLIAQAKIPARYPYFFLQPVHNLFILFAVESGGLLTGIILYHVIPFIKKQLRFSAFLFCLLAVFLTGFADHYWLTLQQNFLLVAAIGGILCRSLQHPSTLQALRK